MKMPNCPLVSIVVPCYNCESTIVESVESAIQQTYTYIEIIIVDDGSLDSSFEEIGSLMERFDDQRISLLRQANKGSAAARNLGLSHAKGEFVVFLDADDRLKKSYIELGVAHHVSNPDTTILYSNMELFDRVVGVHPLPSFSLKGFLRGNCIPSFAMVKTNHLKEIGGFDISLKFWEDWECWIHLIKVYGGSVYRIEEPQYYYRKRFARTSTTDQYENDAKSYRDVALYIFLKHQDLYQAQEMSLKHFYKLEDDYQRFKAKYYNRWYRRLFYKYFRPSIYDSIYNSIRI